MAKRSTFNDREGGQKQSKEGEFENGDKTRRQFQSQKGKRRRAKGVSEGDSTSGHASTSDGNLLYGSNAKRAKGEKKTYKGEKK